MPTTHANLSWEPALIQVRTYLEHEGVTPDEAMRLSRNVVVTCARDAEPASSEEALRLAMEEAKTLALGLAPRHLAVAA
jgi:hypothetical protein